MNTDLISRADAEALFRNARGELHKSAIRNEQNGHPIKDLPTRDLMLLNAEQMIHLLPSVTPQEPKASNSENPNKCEDAISRQAVNNLQKYRYHCGETAITCVSLASINRLPPVNPQPKTGHWIILSPTDMYCSECNEIEHLDTSRRFCAYCGAEMVEPAEIVGPQESEDRK